MCWGNLMPITKKRSVRIPATIFLCFACLYALLRSSNILAVDGAHRCLEVFRHQGLLFHANNHMLYPANVLLWTRFASALGLNTNGPLQFFSTVELMNCFAGAACLVVLYLLMSSAVSSWQLVLCGTVAYGFSKAFLEHATNAAEPLVGVFWSFLATLIVALLFKVKSNWPVVVSGLVFALAMATYQSTILLAPAAIVLIWHRHLEEHEHESVGSKRLRGIGMFAFGGLAGGMLIYGWAYSVQGVRSPAGMVKHFFAPLRREGVYLGLGFGKVLNIPIGLIRNIFPVALNFRGIRSLLAGSRLSLACFLLVFIFFCEFIFFCLMPIWKRRTSLSPSAQVGVLAAAIGFIFTSVPLLIWEPQYNKLWLQPLACLTCLLVVALDVIGQNKKGLSRLPQIAAALVLMGVLSNFIWAVQTRTHGTAGMEEAQKLAGELGKKDFVVGGWDNVSILYGDIWGGDEHYMDFTMEAVLYRRDSTAHLREAILRTRHEGGRVYFLGVVDVPKQDWNSYIGSKCGVPFSDMDFYRAHSRVVEKLGDGSVQISLLQLDSANLN